MALEIYDGPMAGLVFCDGDESVFVFRLLAWDAKQEQRAFSLMPVEEKLASRTIDLLSSVEAPRWPEWWFNGAGTGSSHEKWRTAKTRLTRAAGPPAFVVVTTNLLGRIEAVTDLDTQTKRDAFTRMIARPSPESDETKASFEEWFSFARGEL
ncbi:MAG: hypothetical protein ACT4P6_10860 [Gemmatimonadaceae bacterium]